MILYVNDENIIYGFLPDRDTTESTDGIVFNGEFSFEQGDEKEGFCKVFKWDGEKPIIEYIPTPEPELSQLDRMEEQLGKSQDEIRQEGADLLMEELIKRGVVK